ncbi:carbohydrate kinase family protein [Candidatus Calescamantes bacterium]|nr:carbohydrate kinase family protein [Candidatus Calescamantes bacterium]
MDLVVIGHLLKEKIIFADGREIGPVLGSPAAYASVASAKLGLKTGLVTKIGEDMPEELLEVFKKTGVDIDGMRVGKNSTANLLIYKDSEEKRLKFLKKADNISFNDIPKEYLDTEFFLIAPIDYEVEESLIWFLYTKGKRLSMELSGFGGASSSKNGKNKKEKIDFLKKITKYFEIVKGGKEDCSCIFGKFDKKDIAKKFLEWGAKISIITLGVEGALVATKSDCFQIPCFPAKVKDITGAGDVWHAGFLYRYIKAGQSAKGVGQNVVKKSAIFASATASLVIEKSEGVKKERFPEAKQVYERIKTGGKDGRN